MSTVLFYNGITRSAALGTVTKDDYATVQSFADGSLGAWSHIVRQGRDLLGGVQEERYLFYQQQTGAGAIAVAAASTLTTTTSFAQGSFGTWTHLVSAGPYLLFYNRDTGAGSVGRLDQAGFTTLKSFAQGSFGTWTHMVSGEPRYRSEVLPGVQIPDPIGVIGKPGDDSLHPATIAHADGGSLLFYNITTGAGAVGLLSDDGLTTVRAFDGGAFGHWTTLADRAASVNPYAVAWQQREALYASYRVVRQGASVKLLSQHGETQVDLSNTTLTPEQREEALQQIVGKLQAFIVAKAEDIKDGRVKAADIGGVVYGTAALVIVWVFAPFAAAGPLAAFLGKPFAEAAAQHGRYYGAAVDDLVKLLQGESGNSPKQIVGTLATVALGWAYAPGLMAAGALGGADAWSLTRKIGEQLGEGVASSIDALTSAAGDVLEHVAALPGDVLDAIGDLF